MKNFEKKIWQNKKIMVFPFDLLAHYLRSIVLVKNYSENCEIYFQSSVDYDKYVIEENYFLFDCDGFDSESVMQAARKFDFSWLNEKDITKVYNSQIKIIQEINPDIIIGDTSPTLRMAAEKLGIKYYALKNNYLTNNYSYHRKLSITHPGYKHLEKLPENVADSITSFVEKIAFKQVQKPFNKVRKKEGLKRVKSYLLETDGDINLLCDDEELFPIKKIESKDLLIGPLLYKFNQSEVTILQQLDPIKPTICVTMGSSGDWSKLTFLNSSKFHNYNIITGGDSNKVLQGKHVFGKPFLNLEEVLPHSDLLICHGGNGTIYQGYYHNVFMLCFTSHFEQEWNVHALQRKKAGAHLNGKSQAEIMELIDKKIKKKWEQYSTTPI